MFRTFAVAPADLLDDAKRAAWDKLLSDFEADTRRGDFIIANMTLSATASAIVASFFVAKGSSVQGQPPRHATIEEFDRATKTPQGKILGGPRVLGD